MYLGSLRSNRAGAGAHTCCGTLQYWCEDVQKYKLLPGTTLATYRPCRRRVEQYGTTVVDICKKYNIQTVRHACHKTSRHHSTVGVLNIRMLCKPTAVTTFVLREGICDFPISHNFYRLRYIIVSIRAHLSTQKNCITEDSCILHYLRSLRSERAGVAGSTDYGTVHTLICVDIFTPGNTRSTS